MSKNDELRYGAPGENAVHICVDMQRMFAESTDWKMPWLPRVLPNIVSVTASHPERTIFTRFIPAQKPGQGTGMWRHYYERWGSITIDKLGPDMIGLVPDLAQFVPPARVPSARSAKVTIVSARARTILKRPLSTANIRSDPGLWRRHWVFRQAAGSGSASRTAQLV
jgi:hypothetical protein